MSTIGRVACVAALSLAFVSSARADGGESVVHLISTCTAINKFLDLTPPGPSTGDIYVFIDELYTPDHSQKVGEVEGHGFLVDPSLWSFGLSLTATFQDGTISMQMTLYNVPGKTSVGAITGGTGNYAGARGEIGVDVGQPCGPHNITIRLRPATLKIPLADLGLPGPANSALTPPLAPFMVQSHPNPFSTNTDLEIDLTERSDIGVDVYDVTGRKVRSYSLRGAQAGRSVVSLAATDEHGRALASGVYFCRISAMGTTVTHKLVIAH